MTATADRLPTVAGAILDQVYRWTSDQRETLSVPAVCGLVNLECGIRAPRVTVVEALTALERRRAAVRVPGHGEYGIDHVRLTPLGEGVACRRRMTGRAL